jgi:branched-chain amino acid aminotransferase
MGLMVLLNGKFVPSDKAKISVFDHGLLYGDGVFEGIRSYNGLVFRLKEHIDRLYRSAKAIQLRIPMSKAEMSKAVTATLRKNKLKDAYIRLVVTRGPGDLGLDPKKCRNGGAIFIIADKIMLYPRKFYEKGLDIITAQVRRNLPQAVSPRIKSLNYLNNILAKIEAIRSGVQEAIMLTHDGFVAECTGDNIFIVKDGLLVTPPVDIGALEGITRTTVIEIAQKRGIQCEEKKFRPQELYSADECFLTGTAAEIVPVVCVDDHPIGDGKPGKLTTELMGIFRDLTAVMGVRY